MNPIESSELVSLRDGQYAAASVGVEKPEVEVPDVDNEPNGICICCGKRAFIPPMMHVCIPCHQEAV